MHHERFHSAQKEDIVSLQTLRWHFIEGSLELMVVEEIDVINESDDEDVVQKFEATGGAVIYFSPEVNDMKISRVKKEVPRVLGRIMSKSKYNYLMTRAKEKAKAVDMKRMSFQNTRKLDQKLIKSGERTEGKHGIQIAWTRTPANVGYWKSSETGREYKEKSYALHVYGIPIKVAIDFAKEIRREFSQREVLVVNKENEKETYSISGPIPGEDSSDSGRVIIRRVQNIKAKKAA